LVSASAGLISVIPDLVSVSSSRNEGIGVLRVG
jgi:hypothetical protein